MLRFLDGTKAIPNYYSNRYRSVTFPLKSSYDVKLLDTNPPLLVNMKAMKGGILPALDTVEQQGYTNRPKTLFWKTGFEGAT